ncbi:MAG: aminotransferase class I/II-fold pyridoxal phosphate-dependent enzyme [Nitriliruptor sp.]|uniref:aminotransferase class I/II-fold pyridoxal phosphate-dependent enzyme n=1 Tax=Nitriliruptor sp. TaxID=2448056 RepID=UPI0034A015DB
MVTSNPALAQLGGYPLARLQDLAGQLRADGATLHDFSIGDPDEPTPAFIREALTGAVGPVSRYPTAAGQRELREAVAGWFARRHGVEIDPDAHVLPSAGSKEAIFHLPLAVLDPGGPKRHVVWGDPGYPVYGRGAMFAGGVSDPVTLTAEDGWRLDLTALPADRLDRACIAWVNHPHNPTGATVDVGWYRQQLAVARDHDVLFASDECYQEVWFDEPAPSALEATDGDLTGVLAFVSLSKRSGMTGYRSGAIVGDPELITRLRLLRPNIGTAPPDFVQVAATAAWSDQGHVDERRAVFAAKRAVVLPFLEEAGIEVSGSEATFYVWFRAPGGDDAAYTEALLRERIVASPGRSFGPGGTGWLRLALVPTVDGCRAAVARWREALDAGRLPGS